MKAVGQPNEFTVGSQSLEEKEHQMWLQSPHDKMQWRAALTIAVKCHDDAIPAPDGTGGGEAGRRR